jgi:WD40-like Beta Propeller Repeat
MPWFRTAAGCLVSTVLAAPAAAQPTRVTVAMSGQPDGRHGPAALSRDGRFVVFVSDATNLVAGDTNASSDVFVRDLVAGTTARVSLAGDGLERSGQSGATPATSFEDFSQREIDVSGDGRFVVFTSRAPLVPGDTVLCTIAPETTPGNCADVYLRDRQTNQTIRLSEAAGGASADGPSGHPRISSDGRWIAFDSAATNLVAGDTNGVSDVFLLDRTAGTLSRISVSSTGGQGELGSVLPSLSDDGAVVAFASAATLLSAEPDPVVCINSPPACTRPFLVDRVRGTTRRIPGGPTALNPGDNFRVDVSALHVAPDGQSVAVGMEAIAPRLGLSQPRFNAGWVYDLVLDRSTFAAPGPGGWDGRRLTSQWRLFASALSGSIDLFDTVTGQSENLVSGGARAGIGRFTSIGGTAANGRYVVLSTPVPLTPADTDDAFDVYVIDRDPDADGLPTAWETFFGLDPASSAGASADPDADGLSTLAEFQRGSHPAGTRARYLAEGAANAFFQTRIALANPGTVDAAVVLRHQGDDGETWSEMVHVGARGSQVVDVVGRRASSFSTVIESDQPLVVDRTMTWGGGYGSHAETATDAPSTTHFLAEGATHGRFALFYLLQNPQPTAANVTIAYLRPAPAPPITLPYVIPPASRLTIAVDAIPALAATDVSARIVSSVPILVERAMYMDTTSPAQVFGAGHAGAAVTSAQPRWFLAEGATGVFFDLYYLIANPNPQPTRVRVSYLLPAGEPLVREYDVAAESRLTISVDGEDPRLLDTPVSAIVETVDGGTIVVERSMWWPGNGQWQEGHLSVGAVSASRRWALAAGHVGFQGEDDTYVLIANPSSVAGTATLTTLPTSSFTPRVVTTVPLPPHSRVSVAMSRFPDLVSQNFGTLVESDGPDIVVERAMYSNFGGIVWAAGTAALGTPLP